MMDRITDELCGNLQEDENFRQVGRVAITGQHITVVSAESLAFLALRSSKQSSRNPAIDLTAETLTRRADLPLGQQKASLGFRP
jgi:hypothetical protein